MTFAWPIALCGLGLVALALVAYLVSQRRRRRYAVRFTNLALLENIVADTPRWRRHLPPALTLLALSALVVGVARPEVAVAVPREEATVILAMDSSGSMTATDVEPDRMTAAREAASSFVDGLPDGFRVGVVSFSNEADVVVPPTDDHDEVLRGLGTLQADNGTALGDAIARSVDLGVSSLDEEPSVDEDGNPLIVLVLSDGASTTGDFEPLEAAQKAADAHVPVYTIALGTENGTVEGPDGYGGTRTIRVPPDPETLSQVAETTGGEFFEAPDGDALQSVYDAIGSQVGVKQEKRELTVAFTAAGAALLLAGAALSTLWFARLP
ncbi:MAG TPA: VWA domain-containing protein [Gaiellaceae bacterium]|nr:VWA domain-containing protein [Gaiellaceae bacterium]